MRLNTYLNFGGNCEQAFRFYEQHLGGEITMVMRRAEQPDQPVKWPGWEQSIQYVSMKLGETELMGSDVDPTRFQPIIRSRHRTSQIDRQLTTSPDHQMFSRSIASSPLHQIARFCLRPGEGWRRRDEVTRGAHLR
jgi:PhnB protein